MNKTACVFYAFICKCTVCAYGNPVQEASLQQVFRPAGPFLVVTVLPLVLPTLYNTMYYVLSVTQAATLVLTFIQSPAHE